MKIKTQRNCISGTNTEYEPKRFSGLIIRIKEARATSLIFYNGKIVVLGTKTEEDSKNASRKIVFLLPGRHFASVLRDKNRDLPLGRG